MILHVLILFFISSPAWAASLGEALASTSQLIVVTAENDHSLKGEIRQLERTEHGWHLHGSKMPAVLGKKGLATGSGIYNGPEFKVAQAKIEGDLRSPSGVFEFGKVYGLAEDKNFKGIMPYQKISAGLEGVDDPKSSYYNQIVDRVSLKELPNWSSHEAMLRKDRLYQWLVEIKHNPKNIPGTGSLIFLHVWRGPSAGTAGCVATEEARLLQLLRWLDPAKHPLAVIIPAQGVPKLKEALGVTAPW